MQASTDPGTARRGSRWSFAVWGAAACLLLLPLVAMRFTREVQWTGLDFLVMGTLLAIACGAWEVAMRMSGNIAYRLAATIAVGAAFLLTWINLAVGIVGDERNDANWMYVGLLGLGAAGALLARLRARGLAWTLLAMAAGQVLAAVLAGAMAGPDTWGVTVVFSLLWLASAALFRRAARQAP